MAINFLYAGAILFTFRASAFNLYPTVNPDNLAKSFGISTDCLDALNETVSCQQTLFQMSSTVDSYHWTTEDVTNLCTTSCIASAKIWWSDVQDRCEWDTLTAYGKMIPAESVAGRFFDGLSITCLQSNSGFNQSGSYSNTSSVPDGSAPFSNITLASSSSAPYSNSSQFSNSTSGASSWCLIESQEWVGSDIIRPDCSTDSTDPSCQDPLDISPENERIANLYPNDMVSNTLLQFLVILYSKNPADLSPSSAATVS